VTFAIVAVTKERKIVGVQQRPATYVQ